MSSRQKTPKKPKAVKEVQEQTPQSPQLLTTTTIINASLATALLIIAAIASPVSQLNLSPVYGSIPAALKHERCIQVVIISTVLTRWQARRYLPADVSQYIAVVAYWVPVVQFLIFPHSMQLGIKWGPTITESLTFLPMLFLTLYAAAEYMDRIIIARYGAETGLEQSAVPVATYLTISAVRKLASSLIPKLIGTSIYFTRIGLQLLLASVCAFLRPSRMLVLAFPAILHTLYANPHLSSAHGSELANSTLLASQNYTLLARHESLTGYVSVIENHADNAFRLLRCDHSLLGGEWLVTPEAYQKGQRQPESIFAVFVLLEAVRLIKPIVPDAPVIDDTNKSALVIGLGIGTAPNALIAHGINTTIVELDPIVHHYATKYFALSPNHTAVIDDAVNYVAEKSVSNPGSYNYIIHDVFTGGAEPVFLFTTEFMTGLFNLLTPDGVVAINYAGDISLGSTRLVLNTIYAVFPACRIYRDTPAPDPYIPGQRDFINMVVFCVKNDYGRGIAAIAFRKPTQKDLLGSIARGNFLAPQVPLELAYKLKANASTMDIKHVHFLERYHKLGAVSHWEIMRTVLPSGIWEMW